MPRRCGSCRRPQLLEPLDVKKSFGDLLQTLIGEGDNTFVAYLEKQARERIAVLRQMRCAVCTANHGPTGRRRRSNTPIAATM